MFAGQNKKAERAEIDKKFARVMDAKGFLPGDTRRAKWLDFSYAKKSKKIENWEKTHAAKGLPGLDSNVFEYVEKFRERTMDVDGLDDLCEKLATADPKWIRDFISCNGVSWLFELLSSGVHIAGSIRKQKEDVERLELAIACVVEMINNGGSGLKELLAIPDSFRVIIRSLCFIANDKKSLVFELMAAVLLISEDSWSVVTEAVHHFKDSYPADFKKLLVELAEGEDMDYKVAFLTFINTMIVQGQSIVDRVRVREDFIAENITDILAALKSSHADDQDLQEQCIVFDEELENDGTELKQQQAHAVKQAASGESNDSKPVEIITSLWNKMKGTELEPMLLSILHAMLHLGLSLDCGGEGGGDSTLAKQVWGIIEKLVKQFDVIGKASGITYEHVLAAFMKETSKTAKISFEQSGGVSSAGPPPVPIPVPPTPEEPSAPPPPPPGAPPPPPPGAPPPPPGAPPGPPPAPGMPGAKSEPSFMDPDRPAMLPWRWQIIPPMQVQGTLFADLNAMKLVDEGLIDGTELENIFALKPKILATDSKEEESKAAAIKSKLAAKSSAKSNPTLLSPQRCNIISIVTHRLPYTVEEMTKAINEIDKKFVTIKSMSELRNLFPAKEYEDEMKKMVEFKGEPSELTEAEALMYGFFKKVTRVREKISALLFVEEANEKLKECTANAHVVKSALEELHNEKLRSVLEIALAVGNYLNNPRAECKGFRLSSLLKLNDVVSKTRPKFTLLHHIAEIVERKFPELLLFPDELVHLQEAKVAIESLQVELSFVRKDFELLKHELELCKNEGNKTWVSYLEAAEGKIATSIKHLEKLDEQFKQDILYFGERSADDMSSFFSDWDKFVQSFQTAVKYNITLRRKNEAMQKKEAALEKKKVLLEKKEQAKKKKEEAAKKKLLLAKKKKEVDATNRKRAKTDGKTEGGVKEEKGSAKRTNSFYERSENKGSRINRHTSMLLNDSVAYANVKGEKKGMDVDTMVDDLLQSTPIPDRGARRDGGTVKQLVYSLRTSTRFSKIRDSRAEGAPAAGPVSLETEQRLVKQVSTRLPKFTKEDLAKMNAGHN